VKRQGINVEGGNMFERVMVMEAGEITGETP
jgi:hypothetical protein